MMSGSEKILVYGYHQGVQKQNCLINVFHHLDSVE